MLAKCAHNKKYIEGLNDFIGLSISKIIYHDQIF